MFRSNKVEPTRVFISPPLKPREELVTFLWSSEGVLRPLLVGAATGRTEELGVAEPSASGSCKDRTHSQKLVSVRIRLRPHHRRGQKQDGGGTALVQKTCLKSGEPWSTGDLHLSSALQKCPPVTQKCPGDLTGLTADGDHGNRSRWGRQKLRVHIRPKVGDALVVWSGSV